MRDNKWIIILSSLLIGLIVFLYWQDNKIKNENEIRKLDANLDAIDKSIDSMMWESKKRITIDSLEIRLIELESK